MPTTVSIILPAKNSGAYLNRCIDSVINQSFTDWELLIINDGSSDNTCDIARSYSDNDSRIKLYDSQGTGVSAARNLGIEKSCGEYINFLDSDDHIDPECLSELVKLIKSNRADISQCSFYYAYEDGNTVKNNEAVSAVYSDHDSILKAYFADAIGKVNLASWGKLYSTELIEDIRFDESLTIQEDAFFTFECCMKATKIACSDKPLYYYSQNPSSVMRRPFDGSKMQYFTVLDRELDILKNDEELSVMIQRRKMITALDLTGEIVRSGSGKKYLDKLRSIALDTSVKIRKNGGYGSKTGFKLFLLRHFPSVYYRLLRSRNK